MEDARPLQTQVLNFDPVLIAMIVQHQRVSVGEGVVTHATEVWLGDVIGVALTWSGMCVV